MSGIRKRIALLLAAVCLLSLAGCSILSEERVKLQDLGFTVVSEEKLPGELKSIIDEKKANPFKLTYSDDEFLYIVIGYGQQKGSGYSIAVNELYLTEDSICVNTTLLGPDGVSSTDKVPSCPYIVLKMDYMEKPVIFE
ncbi:MAG: protease complex subunit PrcB family protein [Butyrivibrio sp.]|nr:protease complex subunit PrcB family protein [Muribaculum sp.]MCM1551726.1 protease complex subunit PrcB family protein [Butyrivibrio sp.]